MFRRTLSLALVAITAFGCDVVTSQYSNVGDARRDGLFVRGWLPDVLPSSATDIRVSNNLHLNTSEGHFRFVPTDFEAFERKLRPYTPMKAPYEGWESIVTRHERNGRRAMTYMEQDTVWVFFCQASQGHCEYRAWLARNAG